MEPLPLRLLRPCAPAACAEASGGAASASGGDPSVSGAQGRGSSSGRPPERALRSSRQRDPPHPTEEAESKPIAAAPKAERQTGQAFPAIRETSSYGKGGRKPLVPTKRKALVVGGSSKARRCRQQAPARMGGGASRGGRALDGALELDAMEDDDEYRPPAAERRPQAEQPRALERPPAATARGAPTVSVGATLGLTSGSEEGGEAAAAACACASLSHCSTEPERQRQWSVVGGRSAASTAASASVPR